MNRLAVFLAILFGAQIVAAQAEVPETTDAQIKAFVDQLVSANPPRKKDDGKDLPSFPKGWDPEKQAKVGQAARRLMEIGPRAFPFLIDRWDDERYCMTVDGLSVLENHDVGQVCRIIVGKQLNPWGQWRLDAEGRTQRRPLRPLFDLGEQKEARAWWEKNKTKTLAQMQVDMLDWAIAAEAKNPDQVSDAERTYLAGLRTKIATSGKAERSIPPRQAKE
jgi:hypothetical protein